MLVVFVRAQGRECGLIETDSWESCPIDIGTFGYTSFSKHNESSATIVNWFTFVRGMY